MTPDPLGFEAGPNMYCYVLNSPLFHYDLYGLMGNGQRQYGHGSFYNYASRAMDYLCSLPGRCVEMMGDHFIPIPFVRDVISTAGRFCAGKGFSWDPVHSRPGSRELAAVGERRSPNASRVESNGILVSEAEFVTRCTKLSNDLGGYEIIPYYNTSMGLVTDLLTVLVQKLGVSTTAIEGLTNTLKREIARVGPDGQVFANGHSHGGLILAKATDNLTPQEQGIVSITTLGSAHQINNPNLKSCDNIISFGDLIPFLSDPIPCLLSACGLGGNTTFAKPCYPLLDHAYNSNPYQKALSEHNESFKKQCKGSY